MVSINDISYDSQTQYIKLKSNVLWVNGFCVRGHLLSVPSQPSKHAKVVGTTYVITCNLQMLKNQLHEEMSHAKIARVT